MPTVIPSSGARYFSQIFNAQHASPMFNYIYDSGVIWQDNNGNLQTGANRPMVPADLASTSNVSVSGLSLTVGAVAVTGNPQVTVSNPVLAISGFVNTIVTGNIGGSVTVSSVAVTGSPIFSLTGIVPVSGVNFAANVTVNSVAVTGFSLNIAPLAISGVVQATLQAASVAVTGGQLQGGYIGITGLVNTTASVTVGAVAITGAPVVSLTGILAISGVNTLNVVNVGGYVGITGTHSAINLGGFVGITGLVLVSGIGAGGGLIGIDTGIRAVSVTNTSPIPISGVVQSTVTIGAVAITGNVATTVTDPTSWGLLSGISGVLATNLSGAAYVTGQVSITNTAPIAISGVVQSTVTVGNITITGFSSTIQPLAISGIVQTSVTIGNVAITGFATGAIVIAQPNFVSSLSAFTSNKPSGIAPFTGMAPVFGITGVALNANPNRVMMFIQNVHTGQQLYVSFGSPVPSTGSFSMILNPSANVGWGGDSFSDDHYRGIVLCSGGAWQAWEL